MSTTTSQENSSQPLLIRSLDLSVTLSAILFWAILLYWAATQQMSPVKFGVIFVGGIMAVYVIDQTKEALAENDKLDLLVLLPSAIILISASVYFATNFTEVYVQRQGYALDHEYMLARVIILSILYLTWREFGNLFLGLVLGAIIYGMFGDAIGGILGHGGMVQKTLLQTLVTGLGGFYGGLTQLTATKIAPFLLYAGLLFGYGAFDLILRLAVIAGKYIESGVAQTAVLSSAIIGSINGSYTANAAMTGSFTIPTMKDSGMASHRAAGIEAVASTSGQVLPPIMGASAFVMASKLQVPYISIVIAGVIPAAILVICIGIAVHYTAISDTGTQEMDFDSFFEEKLSTSDKIFQAIRFGLPFGILIYLLGVAQYSVPTSALWTVVSMVAFGVTVPTVQSLVDSSGSPVDEFIQQVKNTILGFKRGAIILAPIAIILIAVGGVIGILAVTGVPNKIALLLIQLSGGVLLFAVILAMLVSILMGVGMPTVAAYVIVSTLVAPSLITEFGVQDVVAQYTVFYAAILAGITPPVATAAVVTAGLAEANFWRVCGAAIKIAAPLFILPIAFAFNPDMIQLQVTTAGITTGFLVLMGGITMIYGLNYPFKIRGLSRILIRLVLTVLGMVIMVYPGRLLKIAGIAAFALAFFAEKSWRRRQNTEVTS